MGRDSVLDILKNDIIVKVVNSTERKLGVEIMVGFIMCPKCGGFMEVSENSHAIICHKCGTLHTISPEFNKALYSKSIHPCNDCPDYTPRYTLKPLYTLSDAKIGAISFYKLHLTQRKVFQTACRVMNRGLYAQALDFFAIIPNFEGVEAKVHECRQHIEHTQPVHDTKPVPAKERKGNFAIVCGALLQVLVMWIIFKILEALLS